VLIWAGGAARGARGDPIGAFSVRWRYPSDDEATVHRLDWNPAAGGSELEVWTALEVLAGRRPRRSTMIPRPRGATRPARGRA
jgi:hypothetical protein